MPATWFFAYHLAGLPTAVILAVITTIWDAAWVGVADKRSWRGVLVAVVTGVICMVIGVLIGNNWGLSGGIPVY